MSTLYALSRLSLVNRVSALLLSALGVESADVSDFVIALAEGSSDEAEFKRQMADVGGTELNDRLLAHLYETITKALSHAAATASKAAATPKDSAGGGQQRQWEASGGGQQSEKERLAHKYSALAIANSQPLQLPMPSAEARDERKEAGGGPGGQSGEERDRKRKRSRSLSPHSSRPTRFSSSRPPLSPPSPARPAMARASQWQPDGGPVLYGVYAAVVSSVKEFGCFCDLQGCPNGRCEGLVHISQMTTDGRVDRVADVAKRGQRVWVKVISMVGRKVGLSMREVDQATGADLKPRAEPTTGRHAAGAGGTSIAAGNEDLFSNPRAPTATSSPSSHPTSVASSHHRQGDSADAVSSRRPRARLTSPERWELEQLIASGAMKASDRPAAFNLDAMSAPPGSAAAGDDDGDEEVDIELNDVEPAFLRGQTASAADLSPIKVVKNPEGSMQRAALTQSALSKERRELREQQKSDAMDVIPADLSRSWEDPMANPAERHLAAEIRNIGRGQVEEAPTWRKETMGKNVTYGRATTLSIAEQRSSLPIFKLREQLMAAVHSNQLLVVIGETGSGTRAQVPHDTAPRRTCRTEPCSFDPQHATVD